MRLSAALALAAALSLAVTATSQAALSEAVDFTAKVFSGYKNKQRGGLTLRTTFRITDDSGQRPPPLTNTTFRFPRGAVVNARYFKRCKVSALERSGLKGCPRASRIGKGRAVGDARPVVNDPVDATVTLFNGEPVGRDPTIVVYAVPELSSPLALRGVLRRQRSGPYGYVLSVDIPPIPTLPTAPNAAVTYFDATTLPITVRRGRRKINYIEGPILCNGTFFLLEGSFGYEGGLTRSVLERFTLQGGPRCP